MDSDQESIGSSSSGSSSSSSISSSSKVHNKNSISYQEIKKEVFIWIDSELKEIYEIDNQRTWIEQKEEIITKLLPALYKLVNKKYNVSNSDLLKMIHGRWRSRHRVYNIKMQGDKKTKQNKRRAKKNSRMQDKKRRRAKATNYLIQGDDKYIQRYPEEDLVKILKNSGYHSEEWEETDTENDYDDDIIAEETVAKEKSSSVHIYKIWWRSPDLCRLLHKRIDPTVELLRKKPTSLKTKRVDRCKTTTNEPPIGAPSWCLNNEALEKFNRPTNNIKTYDYDTDESQDGNYNDAEDINEQERNGANSNKRKRKTKKNSKKKRKEKEKMHKSKKRLM